MARETLRAISAQPKIPNLIGGAAMVGGGEMWGGGEARMSSGECNIFTVEMKNRGVAGRNGSNIPVSSTSNHW